MRKLGILLIILALGLGLCSYFKVGMKIAFVETANAQVVSVSELKDKHIAVCSYTDKNGDYREITKDITSKEYKKIKAMGEYPSMKLNIYKADNEEFITEKKGRAALNEYKKNHDRNIYKFGYGLALFSIIVGVMAVVKGDSNYVRKSDFTVYESVGELREGFAKKETDSESEKQ